MAGGPRYDMEYRVIRPDGTVRVVHSQGEVTRDDSGRPLRQFGVIQDITELRQAEDELRASEAELRARQELLDLAQKAAHAVAFDWYIGARESENRWSPDLETMYGLEPGTFDGTYQGWKKLVHSDDWPAVKLAIQRANESGDIDAEYRVIHKDDSVHWLRAKGRMFFDSQAQPERMVGFMIDVTDRRQAEEDLRASEARFRTFVDRAADAFFLHDAQLRIVDVNRQACESLGRSREELFGVHPREFDVGLDEASIRRFEKRLAAGEIITFETRHRRKDGTVFPVEIRTGTFEQGGELFYLALARDITERKLAEETLRGKDYALQMARTELAHVSRLTTLGELTTSIVHEVSQPLGAMINSAAAGARWLAAEPPSMSEARVGARQHRRRRQTCARGDRTDQGAHKAAGAAHGFTRPQSQDCRSGFLRRARAAQPRHRARDEAGQRAAAGDRRSSAATAGDSQSDHQRDRGNERREQSPAGVDDRFGAGRGRRVGRGS